MEPLDIFYRDGKWYLWAYCCKRGALRLFLNTHIFKTQLLNDQTYLRRPFVLEDGTDDPRDFRQRYWVDFSFKEKYFETISDQFENDKVVHLTDRVLILEKDLYNPNFASKYLQQYGKHVKIETLPKLKAQLSRN